MQHHFIYGMLHSSLFKVGAGDGTNMHNRIHKIIFIGDQYTLPYCTWWFSGCNTLKKTPTQWTRGVVAAVEPLVLRKKHKMTSIHERKVRIPDYKK